MEATFSIVEHAFCNTAVAVAARAVRGHGGSLGLEEQKRETRAQQTDPHERFGPDSITAIAAPFAGVSCLAAVYNH
jgi:hypothetical protein